MQKLLYIVAILIGVTQAQEIQLDDLGNGPGILPFKLGVTKIISHTHTFLQDIDLTIFQNNIFDLQFQLSNVINSTDTRVFKYQMKHLYGKLDRLKSKVQTFLPTRVKRGLLNPLGSIIKEITGNLDHNDALRFEHAIQILNKNEKSISNSFTKHITLFNEMNTQQNKILTDLKNNQDKLQVALSNVINLTNIDNERNSKYISLVQFFTIFSEKVQDLTEEINRLENIISFSRTKSMHHSVLSVQQLQDLLDKLRKYYKSEEIINLDIRYYYDIITLGTYFVDKRIVIVLQFPIISTDSFDLYRLCPIPNNDNDIILPSYPFMASNSQEYVYIEAECQKVTDWYLCEQKIGHQIRKQRDCIHNLIYKQDIDRSCTLTPVALSKEALTELDSQHYILSFPRPTQVQLTCQQEKHQTLEGSFLARIPHNCKIRTPEFTIVNTENRILGQPVELMNIPWPSSFTIDEKRAKIQFNLTSIELGNLQNIQKQLTMQDPIKIDSIDYSVYHTTIPIYTIAILSACVLATIYVIRRRRMSKRKIPALKSESWTQADIELEKRQATFAVDIGK